ncbi:MAG: delayed-early response protein/equilibrative nucleoside transporter [Mesorhizobium amorphae]|nr:MAG: delayed-early response protein/equilibrative nucleoside transporter [Mesorhizobium amorphae]
MRPKPRTTKIILCAVFAAYALAHFAGHAHAQSSLGIGTNEAVLPSTGVFAGILNTVNTWQQGFYRSLTGALKTMRDGGGGLWAMVGLSFAYGVFHAAGPGHGKAVISSYMLANEVALRRGVMLSFLSAFLQAVSAVVLMLAIFLLLRGTAVTMTNASWALEVASYALITLFGAWLLWRKAGRRLLSLTGQAPPRSLGAAATASHIHDDDCGCAPTRLSYRGSPATRTHAFRAEAAEPEICADCGHSHMPDPRLLSGERFDWRSAWTAVLAVGLRPCTGALIVLSFAFLNGLWLGGVVSVLAMSLGTAITVAALATLAVTAKNWAVTLAGGGRRGNALHAAIEIGGAALVFLFGLTLLSASLVA